MDGTGRGDMSRPQGHPDVGTGAGCTGREEAEAWGAVQALSRLCSRAPGVPVPAGGYTRVTAMESGSSPVSSPRLSPSCRDILSLRPPPLQLLLRLLLLVREQREYSFLLTLLLFLQLTHCTGGRHCCSCAGRCWIYGCIGI